MKIAAIIPTCDRSEMLAECLASVFAQTRLPDEVIVVNNGREAAKLSGEFAGKTKVYDIVPYAGVAQARNFGASMAASEIIAFLDDDDCWAPDYLQNVEAAFAKGADCAVSRLDQFKDGKVLPYKNAAGKLDKEHILVYNPGITGTNTAVRKVVFFAARGYDPKLPPSEDKSLVLELLLQNRRVVALPQNQAIIREHAAVRLTQAAKIAEGIYQFVRKYGRHMNRRQRLQNWLKIYRYRFDSGRKSAFVPFVVLYIITRFLK